MILAGDVGGNSTRVALFEADGDRVTAVAGAVFSSASLGRIEDALDTFLNPHRRLVDAACFGVAGPVIGGRASLPNLTWAVDGTALAAHLGIPRVDVINDLEAN